MCKVKYPTYYLSGPQMYLNSLKIVSQKICPDWGVGACINFLATVEGAQQSLLES